MKTILASAYALNPYKGSEDGMGWNFVNQIARFNKVIAITRENNREQIEKYMLENPSQHYANIRFCYYDLPARLRFWKKGSRGAMIYYYLWQLFMPRFIKKQQLKFDIVHNLNFHNDWTPSLLWRLNKPLVWGPVGHHPLIPKNYLKDQYDKKEYIKDRLRWGLKKAFWNLDPLLKLSRSRSKRIICMNSHAKEALSPTDEQAFIMPSVASENQDYSFSHKSEFNILSVGRFVPLKGFDVTIRSFARFYRAHKSPIHKQIRLTLVGSGPEKNRLIALCQELKICQAVQFIEWVDRAELTKIYQQASVFLFPSHEGAGMVVSEALSHGLPVLCFDNCGPGEFINSSSGIKVPYNDYENSIRQFACHLDIFYSSPTLLRHFSLGARRHFENHFSWDIRGEQLAKLYSSLESPFSSEKYRFINPKVIYSNYSSQNSVS